MNRLVQSLVRLENWGNRFAPSSEVVEIGCSLGSEGVFKAMVTTSELRLERKNI
jgi:hypothetical protein